MAFSSFHSCDPSHFLLPRRYLNAYLCAAAVATASPSAAQAPYEATARVRTLGTDPTAADPTLPHTRVRADDQPDAIPSTENVMRQVPGTRSLGSGGFGRFSGVRFRGMETEHSQVFLGDLPLETDGVADLSLFRLWLLDGVEVYRGGAPARLNSAPMGGAVRLLPADPKEARQSVRMGVGSFGLKEADLLSSSRAGRWSLTAAAGLLAAENNFAYRDGGGTAFTIRDDATRKRRNADVTQGYALGHVQYTSARDRLDIVSMGTTRHGGEPGPAVQPTQETRRSQSWLQNTLSYKRLTPAKNSSSTTKSSERPHASTGVAASVAAERNALFDPYGEIGLGRRATDDTSLRTRTRFSDERRWLNWLGSLVVLDWSYWRFSPSDAFLSTRSSLAGQPNSSSQPSTSGKPSGSSQPSASDQHSLAALVEGIWQPTGESSRFELRPSARVEHVAATLHDIAPSTAGEQTSVSQTFPTFRLGALARLTKSWRLLSSVARAVRFPTLTERFGNRAFVTGAADLEPEQAWNFDLGLETDQKVHNLTFDLSAHAFYSQIDDMIRYELTRSRFLAVPDNIARAHIAGGEASLHASIGSNFAWASAVTYLHAQDPALDRRLPLRPDLQFYLRPTFYITNLPGGLDRAHLYLDLTHISANFADAANLVVLPARDYVGAGAGLSFWQRHAELVASFQDLLNRGGVDLVGFPLPGRTFTLSLTLHHRE